MNMKKNTKKSKRAKRLKNPPLFLITSIVFVSILIWLAYGAYARSEDKKRFEKAEEVKSLIVADLVRHLGERAGNVTEVNECFNTEQGPFDNGNLWCQTSSVVQLSGDSDFDELGSIFVNSEHSSIKNTVTSGSELWQNYNAHLSSGVDCSLRMVTKNGTTFGSSVSNVLFGKSGPVFSVSCADRAKAKHYPYSD